LLKYDLLGKLIDSLTAPGTLPIALAYDGKYLWSLDFSERKAYQFDFSGEVVKSIPAPVGGYGDGGLAYDGQYLWTAPKGKLYKFDTSGDVIDVIPVQSDWTNIAGLAWDGDYLWAADKDINDKIFKIEPSDGSVLGWISPPGDETWGMTWVGDRLWACEWTNDFDNYIVVEMEPITLQQ
jgi:glutamine cyclotransferase